jgi:cytochrome c peroxidase
MLFFDPRLSGSGAISCASCHNPSLGWQDGLARGVGHQGAILGRHTPTILNVAFVEPLFWDGRADTLEQQAIGPMMAAAEMAGTSEKLIGVVSAIAEYREGLARIFPGEPISVENVAKLIAAFERTVVSGTAPFDRWVAGDENALPEAAKRGFAVFTGKANCAACHSGWRFTDDGFHDIGLPGDDPGRAKFMPGIPVLQFAFKTPTLRNIAERGPYMHDGSLASLDQMVDHYDFGFIMRPSLSPEVRRLHLTPEDKGDLIAFLKTLTSQDPLVEYPMLPR